MLPGAGQRSTSSCRGAGGAGEVTGVGGCPPFLPRGLQAVPPPEDEVRWASLVGSPVRRGGTGPHGEKLCADRHGTYGTE